MPIARQPRARIDWAQWKASSGTTRLALALAAVLVVGAFLPGVSSQAPNGEIAGLKAKFVDVQGVRTRYYEYGEGEPIVLVHGGGRGTTSSANNWAPVIPLLAKRFHVVAVDRSAAGMTGNPLNDEDLSPEGEVKHLYQFIQTMKLGRVHLVGHSAGGSTSIGYAALHSETLRTLIMVAHGGMPPAGPNPNMIDMWQAKQCPPQSTYEGRKCRLELLGHAPGTFDEEFLKADAWMADQPKSQTAREKYSARGDEWRAKRSAAYLQAAWDKARSGALQVPVLIYAAKQDPISWDSQDTTAMMRGELAFFDIVGAKNPRVKLVIINDSGHFPYREHPQMFAADITQFIDFWRDNPTAK